MQKPKSPIRAVFLNIVLPSLGCAYLGRWGYALLFLVWTPMRWVAGTVLIGYHRLKLALAQMAEGDLLKVPAPGDGHTLLELILSSGPAHEAHHSGQIDYLKGLQAG
jgi:hypothetical protein